MTLFWLLISTQIDWFSVEQLEDFKHEQNVSGSNGRSPLLPVFLHPSLCRWHRWQWWCSLKVENVLSSVFSGTSHVDFVPCQPEIAKRQLWLNVSNDARDITCVFFGLPLPVRNVQPDLSSKHSVWGVNVMCKCVCVCAREKGRKYQLISFILHAAWPN